MRSRKFWFLLSVVVCFASSGWGQTGQTLTIEQDAADKCQLRIGSVWKLGADDKLAEYVYAACLAYFRASEYPDYSGYIITNNVVPYSSTASVVTIYYRMAEGVL